MPARPPRTGRSTKAISRHSDREIALHRKGGYLLLRDGREPLDRPPQSLWQRHGRSPSQPVLRRANVRPSARGVVLWQGQIDDIWRRAHERPEGVDQLQDADFLRVAQVEDLSAKPVTGRKPVDPIYEVGDEAEAAGLPPIAVYRQRHPGRRTGDELQDDTTVAPAHARTVRVEDPGDAHIQTARALVRHGQSLGEALGLVVHAARSDRVDVPPIRLGLWVDMRIAVDLAG